jgi:hypothetical protein
VPLPRARPFFAVGERSKRVAHWFDSIYGRPASSSRNYAYRALSRDPASARRRYDEAIAARRDSWYLNDNGTASMVIDGLRRVPWIYAEWRGDPFGGWQGGGIPDTAVVSGTTTTPPGAEWAPRRRLDDPRDTP